MRTLWIAAALLALAGPPPAHAQKGKSDEEFAREKPAVGDRIPDLTVYDPSGNPVKTSDLRGHYTVLTFGCLT